MNLFKHNGNDYKYIQKFIDNLWEYEQQQPNELGPMSTDAQFVVECLKEEFLGPDWYTVWPGGNGQVNTIILDEILKKHSKVFKKLVKKKRKEIRSKG